MLSPLPCRRVIQLVYLTTCLVALSDGTPYDPDPDYDDVVLLAVSPGMEHEAGPLARSETPRPDLQEPT